MPATSRTLGSQESEIDNQRDGYLQLYVAINIEQGESSDSYASMSVQFLRCAAGMRRWFSRYRTYQSRKEGVE